MDTRTPKKPDGSVCGLCQQPFSDGETVVQVVEDRYPNYDRRIVVHTYHRSCTSNRETVTHNCTRCGCWFHIALLRQGGEHAGVPGQLLCPFCGMPFEYQKMPR